MYLGPTASVAGIFSSFAEARRKAPTSGSVVIVRHVLDDELYGTFEQGYPPLQSMGPVRSCDHAA